MLNDLQDCASPRVDDTKSFVLADGANSAAVLIPADTVDQVWVGVAQLVHQLSGTHVPHTNHVITAWGGDDKTRHQICLSLSLDKKRVLS